jgi:hypothetical protein
MASSFQQYTQGIQGVQGISEAGANIGKMTQQGLASFGDSIGKGIQMYNENAAKDELLTEKAKALGTQIQQYAAQFGNSPEHAEFTKSLQPYIEQLAKVPSQSLSQKMGTVTGVEAAFKDIGQNLQAFEIMRKEKLNRDFWDAKNTTPLKDIVTDPVMIAKGQAPWSDRKTYDQNIADFRQLAQNAVDNTGAAIDINKATELYKESIKKTVKTGRDIKGRPIAPETLAALNDQIAKAEGYAANEQTTDGVTDYSKESDLYDSLSKSASDVVKEKKAQAASDPTNPANLNADTVERWSKQSAAATDAIRALTGQFKGQKPKREEFTGKQIEKMAIDAKDNYYQFVGKNFDQVQKDDGTTVYIRKGQIKLKNYDLGGHEIDETPEVAKKYLPFYEAKKKEADLAIERIGRNEQAKSELTNIESLLAQADERIARGDNVSRGWMSKTEDIIESGVLDGLNKYGLQELAQLSIHQGRYKNITPEVAREMIREVNKDSMGEMAMLGASILPQPSAVTFGIVDRARDLTDEEKRNIADAFTTFRSKDKITRAEKSGDAEYLKEELLKRKGLLESQLTTGKEAPTAGEVSVSAQKAKVEAAKTAQADTETLLGVDRNLVVGTKQREVAMSVDRQEKAMAGFFQKKYGYVPAGFSEAFKANTPEANFKTMETPYGAFMYDGKTWTQIKTGTPLTAKEAGENAAYRFSNPDGTPKEFANSGVFLSGNFEGTTTELAKFRTEYRSLAHSEKSIERLIEINDMFGEGFSPSLRGEAKALLPAIKAALRNEIIGVGTVSNYEQELINDVVAGATDIWSLESSDRAKLMVILNRVKDSIQDVPAIYGLTVHRQGNSRNVEGALRERLQNAGGISAREQAYNAAHPNK